MKTRSRYYRAACLIFVVGMAFFAGHAHAQELVQQEGIYKARVVEIIGQHTETFPNSTTETIVQDIRAQIVRGEHDGRVISLVNDVYPMKTGDVFWGQYAQNNAGTITYVVADQDRSAALWVALVAFIGAIVIFGRMQGLRSLVSLAVSGLVIMYVIIPLMIQGYSPVIVAIGAGTLILFFAIFFTHGFNRVSAIAFTGTVITVCITGLFAYALTNYGHITGLASHESIYLNFNTGGTLDFTGIFMASVMIGMLGVLDDISITQVAVVRELYAVGAGLTPWQIYKRAINVGKEHVGALVNTLVLAYVGVALPTILFFSQSDAPIGQMINQELFASEIIRTVSGTIGLIMTVPFTTLLAVWLLADTRGKHLTETEHSHSHHHGHTH